MMFAIMMVTAIVLMISFDISLSPNAPIVLNDTVAPNALFVCPVTKSIWTDIASGIGVLRRPLLIGLFFAIMILTAVWSWALYQNLLKDKFDSSNLSKNNYDFDYNIINLLNNTTYQDKNVFEISKKIDARTWP